jgi:2-(1,2-epoxy-1,2-dihydrophenyl)acetyl-CoA isomerase
MIEKRTKHEDMPTMSDVLLLQRDADNPAIAHLVMNRPKALNALNKEMIDALDALTAQIADDASIRVVTLSGAGGHFMAGGDISWFYAMKDSLQEQFETIGAGFHNAVERFRTMPKPVVAIVDGACAGGGLSLMLACDLAISTDQAMYTLAYANIGVSPDGGSTFSLPRIVGVRKALELAMLPDRFDAAQALRLGLVNRVCARVDLPRVQAEVLNRLANGPTQAYARTKLMMTHSFDRDLRTQLTDELKQFAACASGPDFKEGVTAFVEKRKPSFIGK